MGNPNKQKGTRWETDVRNYLRDEFSLDVEPLAQVGGADDEGDMVVRTRSRDLRLILEAKAEKTIRLPMYLREVVAEVRSYAERRRLAWERNPDPLSQARQVWPVAVVKARGRSTAEGFVVMRLEDWGDLVGRFL